MRERVWRVSVAGRVGAIALVVFVLGLSMLIAFGPGPNQERSAWIIVFALAVVSGIGAWRWAFVPKVILHDDTVEVRNRGTTKLIPYAEIDTVIPTYWGLQIRTRDRGTTVAWALQKSNLSRWTHRSTRADLACGEIMQLVEDAHDAG